MQLIKTKKEDWKGPLEHIPFDTMMMSLEGKTY